MHAYTDWARGRLDEMDAVIRAIEPKIAGLQEDGREQMAKMLADMKQRRDEFDVQAQQAREQGESAWNASRQQLEAMWGKFETACGEWVQSARGESEAVEILMRAHLDTWQSTLRQYTKQAEEMQAQYQKTLKAEVARASEQAELAQQKLSEIGAAGWSAMTEALATSREAFEKSAEQMHEAFKKADK